MYPTTKELVEASSVSELTGLTEVQRDALREEAIVAIEGHCRQSFEEEGTDKDPVAKTFDGAGGRILYLPKRLAALGTVTTQGGMVGTDAVVLSDDHDRLHIPSGQDGATWASRAVSELSGYERAHFPTGPGAVTVSGIWGWADAEYPAVITIALRMDCEDRALANAHALSESVRSARALGLQDINQGGLSVTLGNREPGVSMRVERMLGDYIWSSSAGALA